MTNQEKIKELKASIEESKRLIEQLEEEEKNKKTRKNWKPERGEGYWVIYSDGSVTSDMWRGEYAQDISRYRSGNIFRTREEAEEVSEKRKVKAELERLAEELNGDREIDWENDEQRKYHLCGGKLEILSDNVNWVTRTEGVTYCLDKNFLNEAKKRIGEEWLKKLFIGS